MNAENKDVRANKNSENGIGRNNPQAYWYKNGDGWRVKMNGYSKASEIRDDKLHCTVINYLFVVTRSFKSYMEYEISLMFRITINKIVCRFVHCICHVVTRFVVG